MKTILTYLANTNWIATAWTTVMCILFFMPTPPSEKEPLLPHFDKVVHIGLFMGFVLLWGWRFPKRVIWIVVGALLFGIAVEFIQEAMKLGRSFDVYDMLADTVGAFLGAILLTVWGSTKRGQFG